MDDRQEIMVRKNVTEHFRYDECTCKCCGRVLICPMFFVHMELLEELRQTIGLPIVINSGYRCPEHNREVGGVPNSRHMKFATDIRPILPDLYPKSLSSVLVDMRHEADSIGFRGLGLYNNFIHLDLRENKTLWNYRQPI